MPMQNDIKTASFSGTRIPFFEPLTGARERELLAEVLDSNYLNDGFMTRRFEEMIASAVGARYCVGVTSGTVALSMALMAAGIGSGDEVLVPDLTFIATANAVRMTGASVRLVDVDSETFNIDPEKASQAIGPKTRAMVPVDVNGRAADYARLQDLCDAHGLVMVCDAAEALGSHHAGRPMGTFGVASCFSFSANKRICTGQGGAITTDDAGLHDRLRELKDQGRLQQGSGGDDLHPVVGFNFKLTNLQAAIGVAQMEQFETRVIHARAMHGWYQEMLGNLDGLSVPLLGDPDTVLQWFDVLVDGRAGLSEYLRSRGIGHRAFWRPLHTQTPYAGSAEDFPVATEISRRGLWLPSSEALTAPEAEQVAEACRSFLHSGGRNA